MLIAIASVSVASVASVASAARAHRAPSPASWLAATRLRLPAANSSFVFDPAAYGGDPTGQRDSTAAVQAALDAAAAVTAPGSFIHNATNHGGATVDLRGGEFLVSSALWVGPGGGSRVCCGALRAAPSFPRDGFLLNVASKDVIEDTTLEDLQLDCAQTGGGIHTSGALRVAVSRVYVHGFTTAGVRATQGHETHITDSFLGQWWWHEDPSTPQPHGTTTGTAILIDGQDHWITDVIIFSAAVGIEMEGGAAVLTNIHAYNGGGPSLLSYAHTIRAIGCYFDYNPVVLVDPVGVEIAHSLFLGAVGVELRSSGAAEAMVSGLQVTHNQFVVGGADPTGRFSVWVNESAGPFRFANDTRITNNVHPPAMYGPSLGRSLASRATEATLTRALTAADADALEFDLAPLLLFDCARFPLLRAEHSVLLPPTADAGLFPRTALRSTGGCSVRVASDVPLPPGTRVTVSAAQI